MVVIRPVEGAARAGIPSILRDNLCVRNQARKTVAEQTAIQQEPQKAAGGSRSSFRINPNEEKR
jgi:hypothetical protein